MPRHVFYSFHYAPDSWRAAKIRNIGRIEGEKHAHDNDWESVRRESDPTIERWIRSQLQRRSCTIVLVGAETAGRKWINFEIEESWRAGLGLAGIYIHRIEDHEGRIGYKGPNPFDGYQFRAGSFSRIVKCYDPPGCDSRDVYAWISTNLNGIIEEAIRIRGRYPA